MAWLAADMRAHMRRKTVCHWQHTCVAHFLCFDMHTAALCTCILYLIFPSHLFVFVWLAVQ